MDPASGAPSWLLQAGAVHGGISADGLFWPFDIAVFLALEHFLSVQLSLQYRALRT